MAKERSERQQFADYRRTFPRRQNERRAELASKRDLTEAEAVELSELNAAIDVWLAAAPFGLDFGPLDRLEELAKRARNGEEVQGG